MSENDLPGLDAEQTKAAYDLREEIKRGDNAPALAYELVTLRSKSAAMSAALSALGAELRENEWQRFVCPVHMHHDCQCGEAFKWLPVVVK